MFETDEKEMERGKEFYENGKRADSYADIAKNAEIHLFLSQRKIRRNQRR